VAGVAAVKLKSIVGDLVILDRFSIFAEKTKWNVLNVNQKIK
jgi:hypothetical protein